MDPLFSTWLLVIPWLEGMRLFVDVSLKAAVICVSAGVATLLLHRSSAFIRNVIWVSALVGLIALPLFSMITPVWNLPLLPEIGSWGGSLYLPAEKDFYPEDLVGPPYSPEMNGVGGTSTTGYGRSFYMPASAWLFLAWFGGAVLCLVWFFITRAGVRRIVNTAGPVNDSWKGLLGEISTGLDLRRSVRLLESDQVRAAITVGVFNPEVVLPADSTGWPVNRRRLVLSHELAHIKRWDTLVEALAVIATVIYWFNPFVWVAVRRLRIERERDCDNVVLRTGAKPSDYAELLMNIAADIGGSVKPAWQLSTISQGSNLKERLLCILNPKINRNAGSRKSALIIGVVVLALILPLSVAGIWNLEAGTPVSETLVTQTDDATGKKAKKKPGEKEAQKEKEKQVKPSVGERWAKITHQESSAAAVVGKVVEKEGIKAGIDVYYKLKKAKKDEYYFEESEFNTLGYVLLQDGKVKEAIGVFQLNVETYPDSWNTYDSLGEAYFVVGDYENATKYYEKSLDLNPDNKNGKGMLEKIKQKTKNKA